MEPILKRRRIIISFLLGIPALLVGLFLLLICWGLMFGVDPLYGEEQDGVVVCIAIMRIDDKRHFLTIDNLNTYPVSVSVNAGVHKKTAEKIHANLAAHSSQTIYPKAPSDSFSDIISIEVCKL
jgi:hypothetical protein